MKKKMTVLAGLLMAVVVTGYSVSGTYAKYISQVDLTDEARVARWELVATNGNNEVLEATNTIDLFANSYHFNGKQYVKAINDTDRLIAPGTAGTYTLNLDGYMETAYFLNFKVNSTQDPVVYYTVDGNKVKAMSTDKNDAKFAGDTVKEYHPLTYTIVYTKNGNEVITDEAKKIVNKTAAEAKVMLDAYNTYAQANPFGAGKLADLQYVISWKWDTRNAVAGLAEKEVDKLDTFAGQHVDSLDTAKFDVSIIAEQYTASEDNSQHAIAKK